MSSIPSHYQRSTPTGFVAGEAITLSTLLILRAAADLGVVCDVFPDTRIIRLQHAGQVKYFRNQISTETTEIGFYAGENKTVTNALLRQNGVQVPAGFFVSKTDDAAYQQEVFDTLQKPLVVKPSHGSQGQSISVGITTFQNYQAALEKALTFSNNKSAGALVEEMFVGEEFRVMTTRQKVLRIIHRRRAQVVGNGRQSIEELISEKNKDPQRSFDESTPLVGIRVDEDLKATIAEQGYQTQDVPPAGVTVFLRKISNVHAGGDCVDVTDTAHQTVTEIALQALNSIPGLEFAGVDFMTPDITMPQTPDTYKIVEVNTSPGFSMLSSEHLEKPLRPEYEFVYLAFPELRPG